MPQTDLSKELFRRYQKLKSQRANWESHWQEVADYMIPRKADITKTRSTGDKRTERIFDSSPLHAVELLAASLHGMLTNPSVPWFYLALKNVSPQNKDATDTWLQDTTERMYDVFNRSNFQQEIFELYHDLITFGTAAMYIEEDAEDLVRFSTRHIGEIFIAENNKGKIDTIFRKFKIDARSAVNLFGSANLSVQLNSIANKDPYQQVEILHVLYPRDSFDPKKKDAKNMPFESVYMEY
jgi:hypothetical protein